MRASSSQSALSSLVFFFSLGSGTESAILNRESGDSESRDSNRAIPRSH